MPKEKQTIRSCMEYQVKLLKTRLEETPPNLMSDTAEIMHAAASLRALNGRADKRAREMCWHESGAQTSYLFKALDSEV